MGIDPDWRLGTNNAAALAAKQTYYPLLDKRFQLHAQQITGDRVFEPYQRITK